MKLLRFSGSWDSGLCSTWGSPVSRRFSWLSPDSCRLKMLKIKKLSPSTPQNRAVSSFLHMATSDSSGGIPGAAALRAQNWA